ncbi:MAG TPA: hypothetical protein VK694_06200 [Verrucomicrobiae bacterium]|nr:hypothetical protein [Verrucomicrobiae bacterium]
MSERGTFRQAIQEGDAGLVGVDPSGNDPEFLYPQDEVYIGDGEVDLRFEKLMRGFHAALIRDLAETLDLDSGLRQILGEAHTPEGDN